MGGPVSGAALNQGTPALHHRSVPLQQSWPRPTAPRPIVLIGAGGIVQAAHLPAYRLADFTVAGIYDRDPVRAEAIGTEWNIPMLPSLEAAAAIQNAVFDLAVPPQAHCEVISALPNGSTLLMQKPMGRDLEEATRILHLVKERQLTAAVNLQLRFSPMMLAVADALKSGMLGQLVDIEVHLNLVTPWDQFPFLQGLPRVEIALHSIHYLDLIRYLAGEPAGVMARTLKHPLSSLSQTRTSAILDYGGDLRCTLSINHDHDFGRQFQDASFRLEGTEGAALVKLGLLLDYPKGEPDELWIGRRGGGWQQVPLDGSWFPHAFIGTMSNLQRYSSGEDDRLLTSATDAWHTMALVEACFHSSAAPGTPVPRFPQGNGELND